jgi:N6-L-threonylcarbamoyladenine synthase
MSQSPGLDFSFSGLKTAVALEVERRAGEGALSENDVADIAASFEAAAVDVMVTRVRRAVEEHAVEKVAVVGGVAANQRLREEMARAAICDRFEASFPPLALCTDNAAMIAAAGTRLLARGDQHGLALNSFSRGAGPL